MLTYSGASPPGNCWDCMKSSTDVPDKTGFNRVPGNRGCQWVNGCYDQMMAPDPGEAKHTTDLVLSFTVTLTGLWLLWRVIRSD